MKLSAEKRENGFASALRAEGKVPAVVYGSKTESTPIAINLSDFEKVFKEAGESTVITLSVDKEDHDVLIHDVQFDVVTDLPIHVDFYAVEKGQKVQVAIPLEFINQAPAEDEGAQIVKVMYELEVEAEPKNLPQHLEVDLGRLEHIHDSITVKDIALPSEVIALAEPDDVIATAATITEEEEESTAPTEVDFSEIEVEKKGKEEDSEEE
jgi:large subunit ribosomal protein L25